jgi:hypothetical protein
MSKLTINVDEAKELDIQATAGTTFDLDIDVLIPLEGTVTMDIARPGFVETDIQIIGHVQDTTVHFRGHYNEMSFATGCYRYVITQTVTNDDPNLSTQRNLFYGCFILKPRF